MKSGRQGETAWLTQSHIWNRSETPSSKLFYDLTLSPRMTVVAKTRPAICQDGQFSLGPKQCAGVENGEQRKKHEGGILQRSGFGCDHALKYQEREVKESSRESMRWRPCHNLKRLVMFNQTPKGPVLHLYSLLYWMSTRHKACSAHKYDQIRGLPPGLWKSAREARLMQKWQQDGRPSNTRRGTQLECPHSDRVGGTTFT